MKLIKILISMTILNAIFVVGIANYASKQPPTVTISAESINTTSALDTETVLTKSPVPTTTAQPKATVAATKKPSTTKSPTATKAPSASAVAATPKPSTAATSTPTPATPTPTPASSGCIVTINGASYNITSLVKSHSGGNVFKCGTDMSSTFSGASPRHNISWMTKYKI